LSAACLVDRLPPCDSPRWGVSVGLGGLIGLLAITQPVTALHMAVLVAVWYSARWQGLAPIWHLTGAALVSLAAYPLLASLFSPFSLADYFHSMGVHSAIAMPRLELHELIQSWFLRYQHPFYGLVVLVTSAAAAVWFHEERARVAHPVLLLGS